MCGCVSEDLRLVGRSKYKDKVYTYYACKPCCSKHYYEYEKFRLKKTGFYTSDKYRKFNRERVRAYRERNPLKYKARYTVRNALTSGKIIKPAKCTICSSSSKVEAHHKDHSKPLDIMWLCKICHIKEDKKSH